MSKIYVGIDNGVTSNGIAFIYPDNLAENIKLPVRKHRDYQKKESNLNRVDTLSLRSIFEARINKNNSLAVMERPMVNPRRFSASLSAVRCLEATLVVLDEMQIPYIFIDSKEWQSYCIPGVVGSDNLKAASLNKALNLFPLIKFKKDGDSMLIAYYAKQKNL